MKLLIKKGYGRVFKFIFISIVITILFFNSSCSTVKFDTDNNKVTDNEVIKEKEESDKKEDNKAEQKGNVYLNIDFDNNFTHKIKGSNCRYTNDKIFAKWFENKTRAPGVLKDIHGRICELNGRAKEDSYFSVEVKVPAKSILTFEKKSDMYSSDVLQISIDDRLYKIYHKGYGEDWAKVQIKIGPGRHKITWRLPVQHVYSEQLLNVVYIDNITIAKDEIESVEIYPKGLQETFENGMPLRFYAKALRGDKTVIKDKKARFFVSGCGSIDSEGLFKPVQQGTCTVSAVIDGKVVQNKNIVVHQNIYQKDPVEIGSMVFTGKVRSISGESLDSEHIKFYSPSPLGTNFSTDGFFILTGKTSVPFYLIVSKNGTDLKTYFTVRNTGPFFKRIWLRFGQGNYTIEMVEAANMKLNDTGDKRYEGAISSLGSGYVKKVLNVKNTNPMPEEDALWLMPSEYIQSDSFYVSNVANSILSSLPRNASTGDKIRETHNWILNNTHYDNISSNHVKKRKAQDAESVLLYKMGVCEGYSNLFAAILRKMGIKTIYIGDDNLNHAWNHVKYNNSTYLVDVTWDDPVLNHSDDYNDFATGKENYTYFMTALTDSEHKATVSSDKEWLF